MRKLLSCVVCYNILLIFLLIECLLPIFNYPYYAKFESISNNTLWVIYNVSSTLLEECGSNKITGTFDETDTEVTFTFTGGHPDLTYECRFGNSGFTECK